MLGQQAPKDDFRRNFDTKEISREVSKNIFQRRSNPIPTSLPRGLVIGSRSGTIAVLKFKPATKTDRSRSGATGAETAEPQISRNLANFKKIGTIIADFCEKLKIFPKIFLLFHTVFEREFKSRYLQRPQPHPSARADSSRGDKNRRIPPRQYSAKTRMARQQSDELEKAKRELLVTDQPLRRRRPASARPRRDSGLIVR